MMAAAIPYYWIGFQRSKIDPEEGTDLAAIGGDCISITPLSLDLTDDRALKRLGADLFRLRGRKSPLSP